MESGEIPVIVPFPIKRDNSVNGTVREHPVWRRCWCVPVPCAAGAPRGCRAGAALQWSLRPARALGGHRGARQHAREPAAGRRAPQPALDGKRPGRADGRVAGRGRVERWWPARCIPAHAALSHPCLSNALHAPGLSLHPFAVTLQ